MNNDPTTATREDASLRWNPGQVFGRLDPAPIDAECLDVLDYMLNTHEIIMNTEGDPYGKEGTWHIAVDNHPGEPVSAETVFTLTAYGFIWTTAEKPRERRIDPVLAGAYLNRHQ